MLSIPDAVTSAAPCPVRQSTEGAPAFDYLDHVARSHRGAAIAYRTDDQLKCLKAVLATPHNALSVAMLIDTGLPQDVADDLLARLRETPDGELQRRIQATPTLRDWFDLTALPPPDGVNDDALILSLRVLQCFAHTTSVPIVFDPIRRTVVFSYAPGRAPHEDATPADGVIPHMLREAAAPGAANSAAGQTALHALDLLVRTNDIDGRRQRSPFWQCDSDAWWRYDDVVRTVSAQLTPEFETWLEARRDSAISHSFFHVHRELIAANARRRNESLHT
ncbi:hypothetical protein ACPWR0_10080 [Pandoraea pneumonica]|uniref:hypothetical protein n=1 Tax=Pandoraea pneumonica TaxID=2508299 RepID=UPI003CEE93CE